MSIHVKRLANDVEQYGSFENIPWVGTRSGPTTLGEMTDEHVDNCIKYHEHLLELCKLAPEQFASYVAEHCEYTILLMTMNQNRRKKTPSLGEQLETIQQRIKTEARSEAECELVDKIKKHIIQFIAAGKVPKYVINNVAYAKLAVAMATQHGTSNAWADLTKWANDNGLGIVYSVVQIDGGLIYISAYPLT